MKKTIDIKGITTTSLYKDGDCMSVINMRKKNGVLKPVSPRKIIYTLVNQYDELFVHNLPSSGENWIGVKSGKLWYIQNIGTPGQTDTELCSIASIPQITQIGNILNILDTTGLKYVIWYENQYVLIDSNFDGAQTDTTLNPVKIDLQVSAALGTTGKRAIRLYNSETRFGYSNTGDADNSANRQLRADATNGLLEKAIAGIQSDGGISGFFFACTAVELYDGSFILQSNPVLCGAAWDASTRYTNLAVDGQTFDYKTKQAIFWPQVNGGSFTNEGQFRSGFYLGLDGINLQIQHADGSYSDITPEDDGGFKVELGDGSAAFVPASTNLADTITGYIPNLLGYYDKRYVSGEGVHSNPVWMWASSNKLQFRVNQNIPVQYTSLIKSLSIFITQEVNQYKIADKSSFIEQSRYENQETANYCAENHLPTVKSNAELVTELLTKQNFYRVKEIPFDDLVTGNTTGNITLNTWIDLDLKDKLGDNLVNQDELPVDNFTHHQLVPRMQMVYNSKLHTMDYKTLFSHGFPLSYFQANQGVGQFIANQVTPNSATFMYYIVVSIKTSKGISKVVRYSTNALSFSDLGMISYPDSRAKSIIIYQYYNNYTGSFYAKQTYTLTASDTQNYAYYISPDLKPIPFTSFASGNIESIPSEIEREDIYRNGMKVSSVNNPFYFPSETTFTIGTGFIRNAKPNALQMSAGQFGQYDVYISTSEGFYSMDTGTTVSYNRISPASLEIPISDILCSTPFGVIFVGKRGIYVINGQEVKLLSEMIEQTEIVYSTGNPEIDFLTFISTLRNILYDNVQNELIFVGSGNYNYVLNITSGMFYLSTEKIDNDVKNVSPNLFVIDGVKIKDYSQQETGTTNISFITRPIYFGIDEVKNLRRAIVRGLIFNMNTTGNNLFVVLYGSNDGVNFTQLRGFSMPVDKQGRDYKDFDMGLMTRATYRNYCLKLEAEVDESTEVIELDFMVDDDYKNDKMR